MQAALQTAVFCGRQVGSSCWEVIVIRDLQNLNVGLRMQCLHHKSYYEFRDDGSISYSAASVRHFGVEANLAKALAELKQSEADVSADGQLQQQSAQQQQRKEAAMRALQEQQQSIQDHHALLRTCSAFDTVNVAARWSH